METIDVRTMDTTTLTDELKQNLAVCPKCNKTGLHLIQDDTGRQGFAHVISLDLNPSGLEETRAIVKEGCRLELGGEC